MKLLAFLLYGGPDQLMPLTSGLTAIFAFLLIFWNKVLFLTGRMLNILRRRKKPAHGSADQAESAPTMPETRTQKSES